MKKSFFYTNGIILPLCIILALILNDKVGAFGVIAIVSGSLSIIISIFALISNKRQHKDVK